MTIDLKNCKTIQAEVNRREYERVTASADSAKLPSNVPNDIVRTFELLDLEGYLPPKPEAPVQPEVAATPAANDDTASPDAAAEPVSPAARVADSRQALQPPRIMNSSPGAAAPWWSTLKTCSLPWHTR